MKGAEAFTGIVHAIDDDVQMRVGPKWEQPYVTPICRVPRAGRMRAQTVYEEGWRREITCSHCNRILEEMRR